MKVKMLCLPLLCRSVNHFLKTDLKSIEQLFILVVSIFKSQNLTQKSQNVTSKCYLCKSEKKRMCYSMLNKGIIQIIAVNINFPNKYSFKLILLFRTPVTLDINSCSKLKSRNIV